MAQVRIEVDADGHVKFGDYQSMRFEWIADDEDDAELQSRYVKGLRYTWRPGYDLLGRKMVDWLEAGKIALLDPATTREAQVEGRS